MKQTVESGLKYAENRTNFIKFENFSQKHLHVYRKMSTFADAFDQKVRFVRFGEMAEWSIAPVLKTGVLRGTGGSNPSLSAKPADIQRAFFVFTGFIDV